MNKNEYNKVSEIEPHTLRLIVGFITVTLAITVNVITDDAILSISESYRAGGFARDIFVGYLFAVASFLFAYNGYNTSDMVLSKIAGVAAILVAVFPCKCVCYEEKIPYVHGIASAVMFLILAWFCIGFRANAKKKTGKYAERRAFVYLFCFLVILVSSAVLAVDYFGGFFIRVYIEKLTYYCEAAALWAFGIAWLVASRFFLGLTSKDERINPFRTQ